MTTHPDGSKAIWCPECDKPTAAEFEQQTTDGTRGLLVRVCIGNADCTWMEEE